MERQARAGAGRQGDGHGKGDRMERRAREAALERLCMGGVSKAIERPGPTWALRQAVRTIMNKRKARRSQSGVILRAAGFMIVARQRSEGKA